MKKTVLLLLVCPLYFIGLSQNRPLEVDMSSPQPRINDPFDITIYFNDLVDIRELENKLSQSLDSNSIKITDDDYANYVNSFTFTVTPTKLGKAKIAPFDFDYNGKKHTSNEINYEVIGELPKTDSGVWIRKVKASDSSFYIIVEQHSPATTKAQTSNASGDNIITNYTIEDTGGKAIAFSTLCSAGDPSFAITVGPSRTDYRSYSVPGNDDVQYRNSICYALFQKIKRNAKGLKITKKYFDNLPTGYKFTDIRVD
ncbi:MAG TPA: BatD family protein [Ferruginibacter sp.]|jgi:hypothetical protein|nr:BatD family protein [Ferruginibacter sp.]